MSYSGSCSVSAPLSLCCHLLSTGASTSTSTSSRASAVTPPPLVASLSFSWVLRFPAHQPLPLVAPPPGTSASGIHHASTFCSTPLAWLVVALPGASPPPLVATLPGTASRRTPLVRLVCRIVWRLGLSYGWLLCCLSSRRCLLCVYASRSRQCSASTADCLCSLRCIRPVQCLLPQGVAPRRERVRVDAMQCSGNTVGVGRAKEPVVRPSCDKTCTKLL